MVIECGLIGLAQLASDVEPKAGAHFAGGKEGFKDVCSLFGRNAGAAIGHFEYGLLGVGQPADETRDAAEFLEHVKIDLVPEAVYVFTPMSKILALPRGANEHESGDTP